MRGWEGGGGPSKYVAEPPGGNQVNFILQNQNHPTPPLLPLPKEGLRKFSIRVLFYCSVYLPLLRLTVAITCVLRSTPNRNALFYIVLRHNDLPKCNLAYPRDGMFGF